MTVMEVEGIEKRFDGLVAVNRVSFEASRGEILGLLGPNGAGKTTAIRMIMGIIRPDRGTVRYNLNGEWGMLDKRQVGYLPEERGLYPDARVLDLLVHFAGLKGVPPREARDRARADLDTFDLGEWANRRVEQLSKGMQQKVQFIAALLHRPALVVLDEPFSGLDPVNQEVFQDLIRRLRDENVAVLLSAHQMNLVEELCDRIFLMHKGQRVLYGTLAEIQRSTGEHVVTLRISAGAVEPTDLGGLLDVRREGDRVWGRLPAGVEPAAFVRSLPEGLPVDEFTIRRPPLHDIFVAAVRGGTDAQ
jgi:ABC-2 type transport system ATP-binding protein